jgi:hypothetical protein
MGCEIRPSKPTWATRFELSKVCRANDLWYERLTKLVPIERCPPLALIPQVEYQKRKIAVHRASEWLL